MVPRRNAGFAVATWLLLAHGAAHGAARAVDPFEAAWTRLRDHSGWQMMVSAGFPLAWRDGRGKDGRGSAVVRYAYAMRLAPGVVDGAFIAMPWARSIEAADGTLRIDVLRPRLDMLGLQGVRPLRPGELALVQREAEAAGRLRTGGDPELVRAFTCNWIVRNGVVATAILPRHANFTRWLDCAI